MTQNCPSPPVLVQLKWTTFVPPTSVWPQFSVLVTKKIITKTLLIIISKINSKKKDEMGKEGTRLSLKRGHWKACAVTLLSVTMG